jgi:hypothetical protein
VRVAACFIVLLVALSIGMTVAGGAAFAAAPPTIVSATADPARATVGDRITLTIVVDHDAATTVLGVGFGADAGALEIVAVATPLTEAHGAASKTTISYTLTAFRTGELTIPPQSITYHGADGDGTLMTDPVMVTIASVLAPGDADLRPLKPQIDIADPAPTPLLPALFVGGFAAMTALGLWLMRRAASMRPVAAEDGVTIAGPSAHDVARAELDAIAADDTADEAETYARIAATVRAYLSARFAFPAYAMTRSELERAADGAGIDRWPARLMGNLLEQCDAVQFAAFHPAVERRTADLTAAYEIVELTTEQGAD